MSPDRNYPMNSKNLHEEIEREVVSIKKLRVRVCPYCGHVLGDEDV